MKIGIVATEPSGDALGAELIAALRHQIGPSVEFYGVGGHAMEEAGFKGYFSVDDLAVHGLISFLQAIPRGYRKAKDLVRRLLDEDIQALVIIDSPEFTHPVARWFRAKNNSTPIFDLVAPTVWAWRPGRARKMNAYIDEVLAVLPFEPRVFLELGGPPCTFVGHPAIDRAKRNTMSGIAFREKYSIAPDLPLLVMLPGSRRSEIKRHMSMFAQTVARFSDELGDVQIVMPVIPHMKEAISHQLEILDMDLLQLEDEADKWGAFRAADLALAASGTVTLELTATQTPMVVAYRPDMIVAQLIWLLKTHSIVLPNLINGENVIPEFLGNACNPVVLSDALVELFKSSDSRDRQRDYLALAAKKSGNTDQRQTADRAAMTIVERIETTQP